MEINKKTILNLFFAFFVFMTINLPSLKILYPSELMNVLALLGVLSVGLIRWIILNENLINIDERQVKFIIYFILLWQIMYSVTWFAKPIQFGLVDLIQYMSVVFFTLGILVFLKKEDLKYVIIYQVTWGTIVGFFEWTVGIPKSRELGQTYLTTGVVIAATIVVVIGLINSKEINKLLKVFLLPTLITLYGGVSSLSGRAPILLSLLVPVFVYLLSILFEKNLLKKVISLFIFFVILIASIVLLYNILPTSTINRIIRIFTSIQNEPRMEVYVTGIERIMDYPLGIGLRGYRDFNSGYPHNIFLETIMSGGLIAVVPLLAIVFHSVIMAFNATRKKNNSIIWLNLSLYYFLTWNISFDLSSSYMVFVPLVLLIKNESYNYQTSIVHYESEMYQVRLNTKSIRNQLFSK